MERNRFNRLNGTGYYKIPLEYDIMTLLSIRAVTDVYETKISFTPYFSMEDLPDSNTSLVRLLDNYRMVEVFDIAFSGYGRQDGERVNSGLSSLSCHKYLFILAMWASKKSLHFRR